MNINDYIENQSVAYATEIFNAQAKSVNEMVDVISKANAEFDRCEWIYNRYNYLKQQVDKCMRSIKIQEEDLQMVEEFKASKVANLIREFINHNTEEGMQAIEREIEITGNPFKIEIVKWCEPTEKRFCIAKIRRFYHFDNWDIDKDIQYIKEGLNENREKLPSLIAEKESMERDIKGAMDTKLLYDKYMG